MDSSERVFHILVIDDNPADAHFLKHAWAECKDVNSNVAVLTDSRDALRYVRGAEPYKNAAKPDLVMLDYRHPLNGGLALTEIKGDPDYAHTPVIVVSGSSNPRDYFDAYSRHANICFRKPIDAQEYIDLVCKVAEIYLLTAVLPKR
ncbi:MAG: response regulator [Acidobacteriaceae bacterium]|nr:response regulator [Acidobacteriaceae bacterium]